MRAQFVRLAAFPHCLMAFRCVCSLVDLCIVVLCVDASLRCDSTQTFHIYSNKTLFQQIRFVRSAVSLPNFHLTRSSKLWVWLNLLENRLHSKAARGWEEGKGVGGQPPVRVCSRDCRKEQEVYLSADAVGTVEVTAEGDQRTRLCRMVGLPASATTSALSDELLLFACVLAATAQCVCRWLSASTR